METKSLSAVDRFVNWFQRSITVKLVSIGFLLLVLLIPSAWVGSLIEERQARAENVVGEISSDWSVAQTVTGPVLVVPYTYKERFENSKHEVTYIDHAGKAFFLPEDLSINGTVNPQTLHRGIFDAVVYESALIMDATFKAPDFSGWNMDPTTLEWKDPYLAIGVSDIRGIEDNPEVKVGGAKISTGQSSDLGFSFSHYALNEPSARRSPNSDNDHEDQSEGIKADLPGVTADNFSGKVSISLKLKGSERLYFSPVGKTTSVTLSGPWSNPSFEGNFLPQSRTITDDSFGANWKVLEYNRAFEQRWTKSDRFLGNADFGLQFLQPVDQYQESIRTSKYSILIILLTFVALLLVEIAHKTRIHPFQYTLIGAALIVYYTLLLSFAEQVGFNLAYWISSIATTALIGAYSVSFFQKRQLSLLLSSLLAVFYLFIFVIVIQQDLSLMIGSIGLFVVVALLMYFSRKINWYREEGGVTA